MATNGPTPRRRKRAPEMQSRNQALFNTDLRQPEIFEREESYTDYVVRRPPQRQGCECPNGPCQCNGQSSSMARRQAEERIALEAAAAGIFAASDENTAAEQTESSDTLNDSSPDFEESQYITYRNLIDNPNSNQYQTIRNKNLKPWWKVPGLRKLNLTIGTLYLSAVGNGYCSSVIGGLLTIDAFRNLASVSDHFSTNTFLMITYLPIGAFCSLGAAAWYSDRHGRRSALLIGSAIMVAASLAQGVVCTNYFCVSATRVGLGAGIGVCQVAAPTLALEIAIPRHRDFAGIYYNAFWYLGSVISAVVTFSSAHYRMDSVWAWRVPCVIQALFPFLQLIFAIYPGIPESPRYLCSILDNNGALRVVGRYHREDALFNEEIESGAPTDIWYKRIWKSIFPFSSSSVKRGSERPEQPRPTRRDREEVSTNRQEDRCRANRQNGRAGRQESRANRQEDRCRANRQGDRCRANRQGDRANRQEDSATASVSTEHEEVDIDDMLDEPIDRRLISADKLAVLEEIEQIKAILLSEEYHARKERGEQDLGELNTYEYRGIKKQPQGMFDFFKTWKNLKRLFVTITVGILIQWAGNGIVGWYLYPTFNSLGFRNQTEASAINIGLQVWNLVWATVGALMTLWFSRRILWITTTFAMMIPLAGIGGVLSQVEKVNNATGEPTRVQGWCLLAFVYFFWGIYDIAYTPLQVGYVVEVLPYRMRSTGLAWNWMSVMLFGVVQQFMAPMGMKTMSWKYYFVGMGILGFFIIIIWLFFPESQDVPLGLVQFIFDKEYREIIRAARVEGAKKRRAELRKIYWRRRKRDEEAGVGTEPMMVNEQGSCLNGSSTGTRGDNSIREPGRDNSTRETNYNNSARGSRRNSPRSRPSRDNSRARPSRDNSRGRPNLDNSVRGPSRDNSRGRPSRDNSRGGPSRDHSRGRPSRDHSRGRPMASRDSYPIVPSLENSRGRPSRDDAIGGPSRDNSRGRTINRNGFIRESRRNGYIGEPGRDTSTRRPSRDQSVRRPSRGRSSRGPSWDRHVEERTTVETSVTELDIGTAV
ncbi:hypothetical protein TWF506_006820 [Arthrobotrys conoides]|uniref:Major facilitator superfamily (MFS) profile domain-containing protein n=1 Tax=Arthrobotrys conoides TaxID=74498 RepID=A0AAN8NA27_9PEZI